MGFVILWPPGGDVVGSAESVMDAIEGPDAVVGPPRGEAAVLVFFGPIDCPFDGGNPVGVVAVASGLLVLCGEPSLGCEVLCGSLTDAETGRVGLVDDNGLLLIYRVRGRRCSAYPSR